MPELAQQTYALFAIERDDRRAAGMVDNLKLRTVSVRQTHGLEVDGDDAAAKLSFGFLYGHGRLSYSCAPMATTAHLEKLNAAQRKAVSYGEATAGKGFSAGPLLIIAGAGTGKTDTLARRVASRILRCTVSILQES